MGEELCFTFQSVVSTKTHLVKYVEVSFILVLTYNTGLEIKEKYVYETFINFSHFTSIHCQKKLNHTQIYYISQVRMNQTVSFIYLIEILPVIWQYYTHVTERLCSPFPGGSWIFSPHPVLLRDWTGSLHICPETIHTNYWIKLFPWTYRFLKTMARILSCVNFKLWMECHTAAVLTKRLELLLRTVFAFPKASNKGLDSNITSLTRCKIIKINIKTMT